MYTPEATHVLEAGTASDTGHPGNPPLEEGAIGAPPAKTRRPEGMPEAAEGVGTYMPAPVEDDQLVGGHDEAGLATEVDVNLEVECDDLKLDLVSMDV